MDFASSSGMRHASHLRTVVLSSFLALLLAACGGDSRQEAIHVGAVLPTTGPFAVYGEPVARGVEMASHALREAHEQGRHPHLLEIEVLDSEGSPELAAELLRTLYEEREVRAAVGGVTHAELARMIEVAEEAERVLISPTASVAELPEGSKHVYRLSPSGSLQGNKLGSFAALDLDLQSAVVLRPDTPSAAVTAETFRAELERNDGEVLAEVVFPSATEDPAPYVERALENRPQAVAVFGDSVILPRVFRQLDRRGFRGVVLTTSGLASHRVLADAGEAAEGVFVSRTSFDPESDDPKVRAFVEAYEERYGEVPDAYAALGYDAVMALARALEGRWSRPSQLWKGMRNLRDMVGVTGILQFSEQGESGQFPRIYAVEDGRLQKVGQALADRRADLEKRLARLERQRMSLIRQRG